MRARVGDDYAASSSSASAGAAAAAASSVDSAAPSERTRSSVRFEFSVMTSLVSPLIFTSLGAAVDFSFFGAG